MAVEADQYLLPQALVTNHMMMIDPIDNQFDAVNPMFSSVFANPNPLKVESDLSYNVPVSRKRSRDFYSLCTFVGEDISSQIQQQQFEIDQFVVQHTEKVRREIVEKRRRNSMKLISTFEEGVTQILRAKEEEITNMREINHALEDKLKSLCIENQIWRELAQTNEATANTLRNNLKQVLEQLVSNEYQQHNTMAGEDAEDAQSCCESNNDNDNDNDNERMLVEQDSVGSNIKRLCKRCGEAES
ncbi:hypothetical protein M8C21_005008, partial [Ambrosia artemisiifolia]